MRCCAVLGTARPCFLGSDHQRDERRVWLVIALTANMTLVEIIAGNVYGSIGDAGGLWRSSSQATVGSAVGSHLWQRCMGWMGIGPQQLPHVVSFRSGGPRWVLQRVR